MLRTYAFLGTIAAIGLWIGSPDFAHAQKGGGGKGGGGGGGARSAPSGGGARSAPSIRSAPSTSSGSSTRSIAPSNFGGQSKSVTSGNLGGPPKSVTSGNLGGPPKSVTSGNLGGPPKSPGANNVIRAGNLNTNNPNLGKNNPNLGKNLSNVGPNNPNFGPNNPNWTKNNPNWNKNNPNWNQNGQYYHGNNNWRGNYYGNNYYRNNNDFWRFVLYASVVDWVGFRPFGFPVYGSWGYAPYYYGEPGVIYDNRVVQAQAVVRDGSADIEVLLPDADAAVWIDGSETTSRGTSRRYETPVLEAGWNYSYAIRAAWITDDGETRIIERQVPLSPGARVTVDFTTSPSRVTVR